MSADRESAATSFDAYGIDADLHQEIRAKAKHVAEFVRLPLRHTNWSGALGNWQGAGIGSSIDFQDHRQYLPGDDPRYINWQAYARTGSYTMKLYREEVSPKIDLVLDVSASMFLGVEKARRSLELFYFIVASARAAGTMLRCFQASADKVEMIPFEALDANQWQLLDGSVGDGKSQEAVSMRQFHRVPWRLNAMRVVLSDLLFPSNPDGLLSGLQVGRGGLLLFCPWSQFEAEPAWNDNVQLEDCERHLKRELRFTKKEMEIYRRRYRQHFSLWQQALAKRGYHFARVAAHGSLQEAILKEPLEAGMVELWN